MESTLFTQLNASEQETLQGGTSFNNVPQNNNFANSSASASQAQGQQQQGQLEQLVSGLTQGLWG